MSFNPLSIADWLDAASRAGVPHVPAIPVATVSKEAISWFEEAESRPEVAAALRAFFDQVNEAERTHPKDVLRWDFCAPSDLKSAMARPGDGGRPERVWFTPDDPRFFDILGMDWERPTVSAFRRPWVQARIVAGFPEEYRVFLDAGSIVATSSYYPQRPLPGTAERFETISTIEGYAARIADAVDWRPDPDSRLWQKVGMGPVSCTMDFLVAETGEILFLEGGPPHRPRWGASPCCFADDDVRGTALSPRPGSKGYVEPTEQEPTRMMP